MYPHTARVIRRLFAPAAGVTHAEPVTAENLLRATILAIPRWSDVARAKADGFVPRGDGLSGTEHYVHWDWIKDGVILDPNRPESIVYRVKPDGARILEAALFILPNRCGPFAPIGGLASGEVNPGEKVACDSVHGSNSAF